jgi:hypothetical protein
MDKRINNLRKWHFYGSLATSVLRVAAGMSFIFAMPVTAGSLLIAAEVSGLNILEEMV